MKSVILSDGTRIENLSDSSSVDSILAIRSNYGEAGAVRDLFNDDNTTSFKIVDGEGKEEVATFVKLLDGANLVASADGIICQVNFRPKTDVERLQDEIVELQDAILDQ